MKTIIVLHEIYVAVMQCGLDNLENLITWQYNTFCKHSQQALQSLFIIIAIQLQTH